MCVCVYVCVKNTKKPFKYVRKHPTHALKGNKVTKKYLDILPVFFPWYLSCSMVGRRIKNEDDDDDDDHDLFQRGY